MHPAISQTSGLTVPERGVNRRFVGFSTWLERVLAAGLITLFVIGVMVESYHPGILSDQVRVVFAAVLAAAAASVVAVDTRRTRLARTIKYGLAGLAALNLLRALVWLLPGSLMMPGMPHVAIRLAVYIGLAGAGFWLWGTWVWFYAEVWVQRGSPDKDGSEPRGKRPGAGAVRRLVELARVVPPPSWGLAAWRQLAADLSSFAAALASRKKERIREALGRLWRELCILCGETLINVWRFLTALVSEGIPGSLGFAVLDPLFLHPSRIRTDRLHRLMEIVGHTVADPAHPVDSNDYDDQRLSGIKTFVVAVSLALIFGGMLEFSGCRRTTPKGILGGRGDRIAKGKVPVQRKRRKKEQKRKPKQKKTKEQINRESVLKLFKEDMKEMATESSAFSAASVAADSGLPDGEGEGPTAAGSPKGTEIGGKYYFFRVKYRGGNWDANRKGIPALMAELTKAVNIKTNRKDQAVTLKSLPKHSGKFFPVLLYMTGNGGISASEREVVNLRKYLEAGGFLFADCSGGSFHGSFTRFMKRVLPGKDFRRVAFDHTIFRGDYMPWLMRRGCPTYRKHRGSGDARGIFLDGRLAVFYSGGDLGAAWAAVGWSKGQRKYVELAFRMGVNIICYAMLYGGEKGLVDEEGPS